MSRRLLADNLYNPNGIVKSLGDLLKEKLEQLQHQAQQMTQKMTQNLLAQQAMGQSSMALINEQEQILTQLCSGQQLPEAQVLTQHYQQAQQAQIELNYVQCLLGQLSLVDQQTQQIHFLRNLEQQAKQLVESIHFLRNLEQQAKQLYDSQLNSQHILVQQKGQFQAQLQAQLQAQFEAQLAQYWEQENLDNVRDVIDPSDISDL